MAEGSGSELAGAGGQATCGAWVKRKRENNRILAIMGRARTSVSPAMIEVYDFDAKTASLSPDPLSRITIPEEEGNPLRISVHPSGDEFVCANSTGCRLYEFKSQNIGMKLVASDVPPLQSVGPQKCVAFSTDGLKFATGGEFRLRISSIYVK